jgi:hypothetical protein
MRLERKLTRADSALSELLWSGLVCMRVLAPWSRGLRRTALNYYYEMWRWFDPLW